MFSQIQKIVAEALPQKIEFALETPPDQKFGDLATNAALILAKKLNKNPRELATEIAAKIADSEFVAKTEIAGPGFINIFLAPEFFHATFAAIEKAGSEFGKLKIGAGKKVLVEFISANPTGPLTIANGRGGFGGDVLARVLARAGFAVAREFYVNDAGNQIALLGKSIHGSIGDIPDEDSFYKGDYISKLAKKYPDAISAETTVATGQNFLALLLETEIRPAVAKMGVEFDEWFSEKKLHDEKLIEKNLEKFAAKIYEKDGATFLRTSEFGDDKDRVLKKADGEWTYFAADIAYHADKFARAEKLIDIWGADHHGYIGRMRAAAEILGRKNDLEIVIAQLVKLFRDGKEIRMSKRAGNFELMDDLISEVGADVARWFFVMRDWNTHLNFDLDLAKKQSTENPVFYVQYAHTRLASILEKAGEVDFRAGEIALLVEPSEFNLIKKIAELPALVAQISANHEVHRLTIFAAELAASFHKFYENCRVVDSENPKLSAARLRLVAATKEVLRIVLSDLVGVSAPTKM